MIETALVTGASHRIGKQIVQHLAKRGWNVIVHHNSSVEAANELCSELSNRYPNQKFHLVKTNLYREEELYALIPKLTDKFGSFSLLINNASVFDGGYLKDTSFELFKKQMNVNLKAPFFLMRDFVKFCKSGNIINLVDTRIGSNKSDFAAYSLSKKALWELTKMAALEFAPEIRVNAIAPGATLPPSDKDEDYLNKLALQTPMRVPGGVEPILKSVDYILENNNLTGQILFSDGGENLGVNN